jgi:hypothetical protein
MCILVNILLCNITKVDDKLTAFVENTKYLQRVLKKELMDLSASEKDLRRLLSDEK